MHHQETTILFSEGQLLELLEQNKQSVRAQASNTSKQVLKADPETRVKELLSQFQLHTPELGDPKPEVLANSVRYTIPFSGSSRLFHLCPSTFDLNPPTGSVEHSSLTLYVPKAGDAAEIKSRLSGVLMSIRKWLDRIKVDVDGYNVELEQIIRPVLAARLEMMQQDANLQDELMK